MTELPDTRDSLLLKVRDAADAEAWEQFAGIYRPAILRLARRRGLQDADAEDLAQRVLVAVAGAIGDWERDASRGNFRAWLLTVARNAMFNMLSRIPPDRAAGGTSANWRLDQHEAAADPLERLLDDEHRRAVFRWAADEIQRDVEPTSWQAFQLSSIDGLSVEQTAAQLGKTTGAVYAARSRVMRRLKQKVREFANDSLCRQNQDEP